MDPRAESGFRGVLTVAVTSRALFDFEEEDRLFQKGDEQAYITWQTERRDVAPKFGTAYPLVKKLLGFHGKDGSPMVEVLLVSRNDFIAGLRVAKAIETSGLPIVRRTFTRGRPVAPYLKAYGVDLFLSAHREDVRAALDAGVPAAIVWPSKLPADDEDDAELRVALDGDSTIFGSEGDDYFLEHGLHRYQAREKELAGMPLSRGPMAPFLEGLAKLRELGCPIRTGLFTARCAPADQRALRTLETWGLIVDEVHCLGARDKAPFLEVFEPDVFLDDSKENAQSGSQVAPMCQVPRS